MMARWQPHPHTLLRHLLELTFNLPQILQPLQQPVLFLQLLFFFRHLVPYLEESLQQRKENHWSDETKQVITHLCELQ